MYDTIPPITLATAIWMTPALAGSGLLLWSFGVRLARPVCAAAGLVVGGMLAHTLATRLDGGEYLLHWVIGGGLAGFALAALFFRLWMGFFCALTLALALPAAGLFLTEKPLPPTWLSPGEAPPAISEFKDATPAELKAKAEAQRDSLHGWWTELDTPTHRAVTIAAAAGGAVGLLIGLIVPRFASACVTSLLGATLLLTTAGPLIPRLIPGTSDYWPPAPPRALIALGLITAVGLISQWIVQDRRADR